jgi:hypothetical protein
MAAAGWSGAAIAPAEAAAADHASAPRLTTAVPSVCIATAPERSARRAITPFSPTTLSAPTVTGPRKVLARGSDRRGVPHPPPLTAKGKWQFAWDKHSARPGDAFGVIRMTAHTYPASAGKALGNRLLAKLEVGGILVATGKHGEIQCYRVTREVSVPAKRGLRSFYASSGPPRLAILVCSGVRRGPGDWTRRTVWFAKPLLPTGGGGA